MMQISDNTRGALYMCIAMAAFTINDASIKAATGVMPLFQAITLRGILTVIGLGAVAMSTGRLWRPLNRHDAIALGVRSVAEVGGTVLFLAALVHMPLANISAILQSLPLAVTLTAALVFGDKIGWRRMLAIVAGFIGVLIIIRPGGDGFDRWSLMAVASVVCVVVRDLATRRLSRAVPSVTVAVCAAVSVTCMGLVGSLAQPWVAVGAYGATAIIAAASALIIGYMFVVMVMRVGEISFVAPFRYVSLLVAITLGWLVFGTFPDFYTLVGSAIVVASGIFAFMRERKLGRDLARAGQ
jgi:drug/metabolite transporter (DMT)-like permease